MRSSFIPALLAATLACDAGDADEEAEADQSFVAVERTGATLGIAPGIAKLAGGYVEEIDVTGLTDAEIRAIAVAQAEARLEALLAFTACEGAIDSDATSTVRVVFSGCPLYAWTIAGDITGTVSVTPTCAAEPCPVRTGSWRLDIASLVIDRAIREDIEIHGAIEVARELVTGGAVTWATDALVLEGIAGRTITSTSSATLRFDAADSDCLDLDLSAQLHVQAEDDLDVAIGDVVLSARNVRTCQARCPTAGEVDLAFGSGQVLRWQYEGGRTVDVTGPRGRMLTALLECAP